MEITEVKALSDRIKANIARVIVGKDDVAGLVLSALLAGGHVLLEDVPGTGKTMLARSLAKSIGAPFRRIQFTPDLLPSDLTGINYFNQKEGDFVFRKGPVFTSILLADEINRATPRTQSSLLECMEERQVSVDGTTYRLEEPYFVIATQNPIETQGTFELPEAQLDRFLLKTSVGYPAAEESAAILRRFQQQSPLEELEPVCTTEELLEARACVKSVFVSDELIRYIVELVEKTRSDPSVVMGVSPRGTLAMLRCAQARAAAEGRDFVTPEDIKLLAPYVFGHRMILREDYGTGRRTAQDAVRAIADSVPVPTESWGAVRS